ncbi:Proteasome maturation protein 12 [Trypanosoma brucei equiperdum]|uniref:Proteasome maturation protein 12 n=1 Tax=Trypanosoma brucei equiperdum TaxID=630700 RepID=A0A3L6KUJ5_9TRYP|nr:Proteasome maturation protein 12 [Trypanosoma brucei equiperdum]
MFPFDERSPSASRPATEVTSFYSSRDGSHTTNDSTDCSTVTSARGGSRLVAELRLELEMRDERIKELEGAYDELLRKSNFDQGQLQCDLQKTRDELASTLETLNALQKGTGKEGEGNLTQETGDHSVYKKNIASAGENEPRSADCNPVTGKVAEEQLARLVNEFTDEKESLLAALKAAEDEREELRKVAEDDKKIITASECEKEKLVAALKAAEDEREELRKVAEDDKKIITASECEKEKLVAALKAAEDEREELRKVAEDDKKIITASECEKEKLVAALKAAEDEREELRKVAEDDKKIITASECEKEKLVAALKAAEDEREELRKVAEDDKKIITASVCEKEKLVAALKAAEDEREELRKVAEDDKKIITASVCEKEKLVVALKAAEDENVTLSTSLKETVESLEEIRRQNIWALKERDEALNSLKTERRRMHESSPSADPGDTEAPLLEPGKATNRRFRLYGMCPRCTVM